MKNDFKLEMLKGTKLDYSSSTKKFDFYGYSSVSNGTYRIDDKIYSVGHTNLNEKQFGLYADCGMTIFFPQNRLEVKDEETWNNVKGYIDLIVSKGIDKTILFDPRISHLSLSKESVVGEGKQFKSLEELDAAMESYLKLYINYPGVYGVMLGDEPKYYNLDSYAEVYNSLKRVREKNKWNFFIQYNLNPFSDYYQEMLNVYGDVEFLPYETMFIHNKRRYIKYINDFLDRMNPDHLEFDSYPFRVNFMNKSFFPGFEILADICKERQIPLFTISQTFSMKSGNSMSHRIIDRDCANYLNNITLGYGVKQIAYFTYFTKADNDTKGESFIDKGSFITLDGKPTKIYYFMKDILKKNQDFAKIILNFEYQDKMLYTNYPMDYDTFHLSLLEKKWNFKKLKSFTPDKGCTYATELYDKEKDNYMYMIMNVIDPRIKGKNTIENITIEFGDEYTQCLVYRDGNYRIEKLIGNKFVITLKPGEADFVMPF